MNDLSGGLVIATLSTSYSREKETNKARDLGLVSMPKRTPDGKPICGGGTHLKSDEAAALVKARDRDAARIRKAFDRAFAAAPFNSTYLLPEKGAGQSFLAKLDPRPRGDVRVTVNEYVLGVVSQDAQEVAQWSERITKQLNDVPLGRGKRAAREGLAVIENLVQCPVITDESRTALLALIRDAKLARVDRVDFRRKLEKIPVNVSAVKIEPRQPTRGPVPDTPSATPQRSIRPGRPTPAAV